MVREIKSDNGHDGRDGTPSTQLRMLITRERVAYVGLLGRPKLREFGSLVVYVALDAPFQIQIDGGEWLGAGMFVVAPDTPHRIASSDRLIGVFMIEPETVAIDGLPAWLLPSEAASQCLPALEHVRAAFRALCANEANVARACDDMDLFFLGRTLPARVLDARMAAVVEKINQDPCGLASAEDCARLVNLSFSRFLHLFKDEVGTTFRSFRAWKRARSFLCHVNTASSLTDIALDIGYPDSSHFSHTVRRYWGLTPRDILAGSRRLAVSSDHPLPVAA